MNRPRWIVESKGLASWIVRDREDPMGHEEPRFEGSEVECRAVAEALGKRSRRKVAEVSESAEARLLDLIDALVFGTRDAQELARDIVSDLWLGAVCGRCEMVYLGDFPERCEACDTEMEGAA